MNNKTWELINWCEFDKYAIKSYCAIHNETEDKNLGDITKVNEKEIADFNMMVGGSPCQDFSIAGKQKGVKWTCQDCGYEYNPLEAEDGNEYNCPKCNSENIEKTRSSLIVEWLRILKEKKPNFAMYENVKNIVGKTFKPTYELFIKRLHSYGYNTYWKVLNAKNYGIPQNRERVYLIIIKKELDNGLFEFPQEFDEGVRLKDILDAQVDEKFYINNDKNGLETNILKSIKIKNTNNLIKDFQIKSGYDQSGRVYNINGISPTLMSNSHGVTTGGYIPPKINYNFRIRKLTPKECYRLMGFSDIDFEKANKVVSNSQLYKQAGNSIVVDVLFYILIELYKAMPYLFDDIKLGSFFSGIGAFEKALDRLFKSIGNENIDNSKIRSV